MKKTKGGGKKEEEKENKKVMNNMNKKKENIIKLVETESNGNSYLRCPCLTLQKEGQNCN